MGYIEIKLNNGDKLGTRINGTEKEVIDHYNTNNLYNFDNDTQVVEVKFIYEGQGVKGDKTISRCYLFEKKEGYYQY